MLKISPGFLGKLAIKAGKLRVNAEVSMAKASAALALATAKRQAAFTAQAAAQKMLATIINPGAFLAMLG